MPSLIPWKRSSSPTDATWMLNPARADLSQIVSRFMDGFADSSDLFDDPIRIDVRETDDEVIVRAEVPGIDPKDLDIQLVGDVLTLSGDKKDERQAGDPDSLYSERRYGAFRRALRLSTSVDPEKVSAQHRNGVVTITLTKAQSNRPRRIQVQAS